MWWIVSLVALVVSTIEAVAVTFVVMVALNGFPSLANAFAFLYLACTGGVMLVMSLLDGFLAKKFSEATSLPLWFAGVVTVTIGAMVMPVLLIGLTGVLMLAFDML